MNTEVNHDENINANDNENENNSEIINNRCEDTKKQLSYLELILKYKNKINVNYNEFDFQKGESSPRLLFKKRKSDINECIGYSSSKISNIFINRCILDRKDLNSSIIGNAQASSQTQANINMNTSTNVNIDSSSNLSNINVVNILNNIQNNSSRNGNVNYNNFQNTCPIVSGTKNREKDNIDFFYNQIEDKIINTSNNKIFKVLNENTEQKQSNTIKSTFENYLDIVHDSYFTQEEPTRIDNINNISSHSVNMVGLSNNGEDPVFGDEDNSNLTNNNNSMSNKNSEKKINNINQSSANNPLSSNFLNIFNSKDGTSNTNLFKFSSLDLLVNPLRQKYIWETWSPYEVALFECCICKFGKNFDLYPKIIRTKKKDEILFFYYYWKQSKYYKVWKNSKYKRAKN